MTDMVEKNLIGDGELAVCFGLCSFHMRTFSQAIPLFHRPARARPVNHADTMPCQAIVVDRSCACVEMTSEGMARLVLP
jgi:hypothetical protein